MITAGHWRWQDSAQCHQTPDLFFGPEDESLEQQTWREALATQVCVGCPVRRPCLDRALSHREQTGVWGGMGERDRERLRRRRQRKQRSARHRERSMQRPGYGPTTGDERILQGLAADGYGLDTVRSWTHLSKYTLGAVRSGIQRSWALSSSRKLRETLPLIRESPPLRFTAVSTWALNQGWVSLDAWQGVNLDDPLATPAREGVEPL